MERVIDFLLGAAVGAAAWHFFGAMAIDAIKAKIGKKDA